MVLRYLAGAVAALALALFGLTPAQAHSGKRHHMAHDCCTPKKPKKAKAEVRCGKYCAIHQALSAKSHKPGKWHGWVVSRKGVAFHLNGARYKGGVPCGPPMAYNNWEGGFHRRAFRELTDRDRY
jgi:hypothetical protein